MLESNQLLPGPDPPYNSCYITSKMGLIISYTNELHYFQINNSLPQILLIFFRLQITIFLLFFRPCFSISMLNGDTPFPIYLNVEWGYTFPNSGIFFCWGLMSSCRLLYQHYSLGKFFCWGLICPPVGFFINIVVSFKQLTNLTWADMLKNDIIYIFDL